jgi:hypothetical protein
MSQPATAVYHLRLADKVFPLDYRFRKASALYLAGVADSQHNPDWDKAALAEVYSALRIDPTSADLMNAARVLKR